MSRRFESLHPRLVLAGFITTGAAVVHASTITFIDQSGWLVYDERARRAVDQSAGGVGGRRQSGGAMLQAVFADYLTRQTRDGGRRVCAPRC